MTDNDQRNRILALVKILFQHIGSELNLDSDERRVIDELLGSGFDSDEIEAAIEWVSSANQVIEEDEEESLELPGVRIYTLDEQYSISPEARGLLYRLRNLGIIDSRLQESIIERAVNVTEGAMPLQEMKMLAAVTIITESDRNWQREVGCMIEDNWNGLYH